MKHQQVVIDYWNMVKTSLTYLLLAFFGYILLRLLQTIFWLPRHLNKNQQMLEELASKYSIDMDQVEAEVQKELSATGNEKTPLISSKGESEHPTENHVNKKEI